MVVIAGNAGAGGGLVAAINIAHGLFFRVVVQAGLGFGHEIFGAVHFDAPGTEECAFEIWVVQRIDAHGGAAVGAVDKLAVAHIDAGVIAPAGVAEGDNIANLHLFHIIDALTHNGLFTGGARQAHANAFVCPADKSRAVKSSRRHAAGNIWGADGRPCLAQKLLTALLFVIVKSSFIRTAKTLFRLCAVVITLVVFYCAAKGHGASQSQRTQFQASTHRHSVWVAPQHKATAGHAKKTGITPFVCSWSSLDV